MGIAWSSYKEKRKEKKELKRFDRYFAVFVCDLQDQRK